jgi:hypothetical protein
VAFHVVLWDALFNAVIAIVNNTKVELRECVSLVCGLAIPRDRPNVILRDTLSVLVHIPKAVLRGCESLVGGLAIPRHGLGVILRDAPSGEIRIPKASRWWATATCTC